ncbi:cysteine-rich receptor-like protein kinase [Tanacetum coccineum]|uniref:Cysteine-rich receptor-like protein kinase n=1 Tax=Tanacetum coccineum TaxID=301880 RepID=A0ABQ4WBQ2_9ASTR
MPSFSNPLFRGLSDVEASFLESSYLLMRYRKLCGIVSVQRPLGRMALFLTSLNLSGINPLGFSYYRPISLIGCIYKVIAKVLASRLAKVTDSIIRHNQSTFIKGRQIFDGCLISNEIIRMVSHENSKLLLFKVDFEKAFDCFNLNFTFKVMRQMGFDSKWRDWIASWLSSASIYVMINGSPSKEFMIERGLCQGNPISLLLFLIVVEALQVNIFEACNKGLYNGFSLAGCGANVKEVGVLENLKVALGNEGFTDIDLRYMGGLLRKNPKSKDGVVASEQIGKQSEDPFNIYSLLNKDKMKNNKEASTKESLEYPPGFTPRENDVENVEMDNQKDNCDGEFGNVNNISDEVNFSSGFNTYKKAGGESMDSDHCRESEGSRKDGSLLMLMDELVKVGQTMGYNMDGCMKNIEEIIESQGVDGVFR